MVLDRFGEPGVVVEIHYLLALAAADVMGRFLFWRGPPSRQDDDLPNRRWGRFFRFTVLQKYRFQSILDSLVARVEYSAVAVGRDGWRRMGMDGMDGMAVVTNGIVSLPC